MENIGLIKYEVILHWIAVGIYILSTVLFTYSVAFQKARSLDKGSFFAFAGLFPHGIALIIRWYVSGHGPYMAKYEVMSSIAWVSILMFLFISWKIPRLKTIGFVVMPLSFLLMTIGLFTDPGIRELPPALSGIWLVMHVIFNKLAAGAALLALGAAVLYLLKKKNPGSEVYKNLPSLEVLDDYCYKFISFGFIFWSITTVAGSIWANQAWGRYWGWDPIEIWSIITWLLYGLYLHLRQFFKWSGTKAAWLLIICFTTSVITIFIIPVIVESLHSSYFM